MDGTTQAGLNEAVLDETGQAGQAALAALAALAVLDETAQAAQAVLIGLDETVLAVPDETALAVQAVLDETAQVAQAETALDETAQSGLKKAQTARTGPDGAAPAGRADGWRRAATVWKTPAGTARQADRSLRGPRASQCHPDTHPPRDSGGESSYPCWPPPAPPLRPVAASYPRGPPEPCSTCSIRSTRSVHSAHSAHSAHWKEAVGGWDDDCGLSTSCC